MIDKIENDTGIKIDSSTIVGQAVTRLSLMQRNHRFKSRYGQIGLSNANDLPLLATFLGKELCCLPVD